MVDLYIDEAMLRRVRDNLAHIQDLLGKPAAAMKHTDGAHLGPDALVSRVNDFGDEWHYGIGQLGKFSGSAVNALDQIDKAFTEADTNLANALNKAKKGDS